MFMRAQIVDRRGYATFAMGCYGGRALPCVAGMLIQMWKLSFPIISRASCQLPDCLRSKLGLTAVGNCSVVWCERLRDRFA